MSLPSSPDLLVLHALRVLGHASAGAVAARTYGVAFRRAALETASAAIAGLDPFSRAMMLIYAAMPVAGNVFILAQHYGIAPQRVSASILISTAVSTSLKAWVITK